MLQSLWHSSIQLSAFILCVTELVWYESRFLATKEHFASPVLVQHDENMELDKLSQAVSFSTSVSSKEL
uniref:Uncharacterized protein n=1 Tax=Arundo donax TaxID=35708 RepID=A0A0A9CWS6_ARUDO